jgi:tetratricopeptide (TPR) repeat protein
MPSSWSPPVCALLALGFAAIPPRPARADPAEAWQDAALYLFNDAHRAFQEGLAAHPAGPNARESSFGEAMTLLNVQPQTEDRVTQAAALLTRLKQANANDPVGIAAWYFLARIAQVHQARPDPERALATYDALAAAHPDALFGQLALLKSLVLRLYAPGPPAEARRRLADAESLAARFPDPAMLAEYHLVMFAAYARYRLDERAQLAHLLAADRAGITRPEQLNESLFSTAELARELGDRALAIVYYKRFLAEFPSDFRAYHVRERLAALGAPPP